MVLELTSHLLTELSCYWCNGIVSTFSSPLVAAPQNLLFIGVWIMCILQCWPSCYRGNRLTPPLHLEKSLQLWTQYKCYGEQASIAASKHALCKPDWFLVMRWLKNDNNVYLLNTWYISTGISVSAKTFHMPWLFSFSFVFSSNMN